MEKDTAFQMATSNMGVTRELGMDLADMKAKHVMVVTDTNLVKMGAVSTVLKSLDDENIDYEIFDRVRIEPTDESLKDAIAFAQSKKFDAFVAVGGGSSIDTAKAADLYTTYPADFLEYVNAPVGKGTPVPGSIKPLFAVPTTAGTGSETTGVVIFDLVEMHAKTGIANLNLKPTLGILDPDNTKTMPPIIAASTQLRPAYQGCNPISDTWSLHSLELVGEFLPRAVQNPNDDEARGKMLLAASYAGIGFGNAGLHLAHGMSYPVSGMVHDYKPDEYKIDHPIVPHGIAVVLNAPAVFRFTGSACPERHLRAAEALGVDITDADPADAGDIVADRIIHFMKLLDIPNGLAAVGYTADDIPGLVKGTLPQHRVTKLSPRPAGEKELTQLFQAAMSYW